jgi:hypothetical protein
VERSSSFFRGSEFSRLVILSVIVVGGWVGFWFYARRQPKLPDPPLRAIEPPKPVVPDRSIEFETVTDRTPFSFRDNAGFTKLLERARSKTLAALAAESRRDIVLTHLWERPEHYRGVPVHLTGTAVRVIRSDSKLSQTGWIYEASIITPEARRIPYQCVFEDVPKGFPIGTNISERVVFNGYFLKIMKYEAGDVARGAPLLIGRIGWEPGESAVADNPGMSSTLTWTLILLGVMFFISLVRWLIPLRRLFTRPGPSIELGRIVKDEFDAGDLVAWVQSVAHAKDESIAPENENQRAGQE